MKPEPDSEPKALEQVHNKVAHILQCLGFQKPPAFRHKVSGRQLQGFGALAESRV